MSECVWTCGLNLILRMKLQCARSRTSWLLRPIRSRCGWSSTAIWFRPWSCPDWFSFRPRVTSSSPPQRQSSSPYGRLTAAATSVSIRTFRLRLRRTVSHPFRVANDTRTVRFICFVFCIFFCLSSLHTAPRFVGERAKSHASSPQKHNSFSFTRWQTLPPLPDSIE